MAPDVDVVVVGGGPAGAAAGWALASRGRSVVVCEQKLFPREKACGDGLTPRAVAALSEMGLDEQAASWRRVAGVRVHAGRRSVELVFPRDGRWPTYGLVKPRAELDRVVLEQARRSGAEVLYGTRVVAPIVDDGMVVGVIVDRDGRREPLHARVTVCAEGAAGRLTRLLGASRIARFPTGVALREYLPHRLGDPEWFEVHFDVRGRSGLLPGYGWVFPVNDATANVGVGLLRGGVPLHSLQDAFVAAGPSGVVAGGREQRRGGRLALGGSVWPPHGRGFVLVGDAAGMGNPFTGEGIAYAYETGFVAARHVDLALATDPPAPLSGYTAELTARYGPYFRFGRAFTAFVSRGRTLDVLLTAALRWERAMNSALKIMMNLSEPSTRRMLARLGTGVPQRTDG